MMDISRISLTDLQQLLIVLPEEIEKRRAQERELVREELAALARARGFVLDELIRLPQAKVAEVQIPAIALRRSARVKFRHPRQADLAWTGRGRTPRWVSTWLAEGRTMAELTL